MDSFFEALITYPLLLYAFLAAITASMIGGIVGSYVIVKRISFLCGSISHSILGGIGIFLWLQRVHDITWAVPILGALIAAIVSAFLIGWIRLYYQEREDAVIAAIWSLGMAIGMLFISKTPGYNIDLTNFIVGNILWVSRSDLILLASFDCIALIALFFLHERITAVCFDEQQARMQGLRVNTIYFSLLILIACTIVVLIQTVGILLVMTMLTLPATIASLFTTRLKTMMFLAAVISIVNALFGMFIAFQFDIPPGATTALLATISYIVALVCRRKCW